MAQISYIKYTDVLEAHRYDAEYFKPEYHFLRKKLKNLKHNFLVDYLSLGKVVTGHTPSMDNESFYGGIVKFIKTDNLRENYIKEEFNHYLSLEGNKILKTTELKENDILVTIIGATEDVVGRVCIVNKEILPANINQNIALIRVDKTKINPHFLNLYLNSKFGRKYLHSLSRQTEQVNLNCREVERVIVPILPQAFQLQIEQIVKLAHQKQTQSKQLYRDAEELILSELGLLDYKIKHSLWFTTTKNELNEAHRYDSEYFQPKYAEIIKKIKKYKGGWDFLKNQFKVINGKTPEQYFEEEEIQVLKTKQIRNEAIQYDGVTYSKKEFVTNILQERDILFASMGVGSLGRTGIFYNFETDRKTSVDSTVKIFRNAKNIEPEVLQIFFNSVVGQEYIYRYIVGSTGIISIKNSFLLNIKIPLIKPSIQKQIAEKVQESHKLRKESKELLEEAKIKVEEEIEK